MRIAFALALAACTRPASVPLVEARAPRSEATSLEARASEVARPCDLAGWKARTASPLRVRIAGTDVIEIDGGRDRSQVLARFGPSVFVAGEVSEDRLERVVVHETSVARAPGGPWLPGVVAEPGLPVSGSGAWLSVHADAPLEVTGFVPLRATGTLWIAQDAAPAGHSLASYSEVLAAPAFGAEQVAAITGGYDIVDRTEDGPAGWRRVEARTAGVRVTGWVQVSRPSPLHNVYDFSDDTIEGDLVRPDSSPPRPEAGPGCIRARARDNAPIVGIVTDTITGRPFAPGWLELRLAAPWGRVVGYVRTAEPPALRW